MRILSNIGAAFDPVVDFIYPPCCVLCRRRLSDARDPVCFSCLSSLPFIDPPFCSRCGMPSGLPEEECLACAGRTFHFTGACAALIFDQAAQKMIHELKYHHRRSVGRFLGALLGKKIVRESLCPHISCIVPMPIHPVRRRERGFNQAEVIAEGVSSVTGWPVQNGLIKRTRWRSSQTALTTEERTRNVKSVFGIAETAVLEGMRVALVDDVFTTGATLDSCAKTLLDAGASVVYAFTVARA